MSKLFETFKIRSVTLPNRVGMSPMCMYSCFKRDGKPTSWHMQHHGARAAGGVGLLFTEATSVEPRGRISLQDTGIWNDEQADAWRPIIDFVHSQGSVIGMQIAHSGRKGACYSPFEGRGVPLPESEMYDSEGRGVKELHPVAASAIPYDDASRTPHALTEEELKEMKQFWVDAAKRAVHVGFDVIELHFAHGYLMHGFLSPLTNVRSDKYGGKPFENRIRFPLEVVEAVRAAIPSDMPLFVRISAHDWADNGWDVDQSIEFAKRLKDAGVDVLDVSSGGAVPGAKWPVVTADKNEQGYQVPFAEQIRKASGITTACVGLISDPDYAEDVLQSGKADLVFLGRELLYNPNWVHHAKYHFNIDQVAWPPQYAWGMKMVEMKKYDRHKKSKADSNQQEKQTD